jgi:hypothetical protein
LLLSRCLALWPRPCVLGLGRLRRASRMMPSGGTIGKTLVDQRPLSPRRRRQPRRAGDHEEVSRPCGRPRVRHSADVGNPVSGQSLAARERARAHLAWGDDSRISLAIKTWRRLCPPRRCALGRLRWDVADQSLLLLRVGHITFLVVIKSRLAAERCVWRVRASRI